MPKPPDYNAFAHERLKSAADRLADIGDDDADQHVRWEQDLAEAHVFALLDIGQALDANTEAVRDLHQRIEKLGPIPVSPVHPGAI